MKYESRGFTLIETLLVLLILMIMTAIVMTFSFKQWKEAQYEEAIEKFKLTMYQAQMVAKQEQKVVNVYVVEQKYVKTGRSFPNYDTSWEIPNGMAINIYTNKTYITFNPLGSVKELGKVEFITPTKKITYSINMSKGRLRLIE